MIKAGRIVVVGGNAAGPAAAAKAKRVNPGAEVKMFESGGFISTGTCEMPYVLSGEISGYEKIIFYSPEKFKQEKGAEVFVNHLVESINRKEKFIEVRDLKENITRQVSYDKLILATGSTAKKIPGIPSGLKNVFRFKTVEDLFCIQRFIQENKCKTCAVFGAGYVGLEAADALQSLQIETVLIEKEKLPLPSAEVEIGFLVRELLKKNGVRTFFGISNPLIHLSDCGQKIKSIEIESRQIEVDFIITAAGFSPNNHLAQKAKLELGKFGGIKVESNLRTSDPDIFAAGDNIEVKNAITNKSDYIPLAAAAHEYGHIAGANAAGENHRAEPVIKNLAVKIFDRYFVSVGISSDEAGRYGYNFATVSQVVPNLNKVMPASENVFGKIIFEKESKRILGAAFLGGKEASGYGNLISGLIKTRQSAEVLAAINYNYTPPLSPLVNLLSVLGRKIK